MSCLRWGGGGGGPGGNGVGPKEGPASAHLLPVPLLPRDKGMRHMVGPDWRQLFDVVIVQADKPSFFTDRRKYGPSRGDEGGERALAFAHHPVCLGWGHPLVSTQPM